MARLFYRGEWFYELSPTALAEKEFEGLVIANSEAFKPDCWIVPYSRTVYAQDGSSARADLAFIDKQYREWSVIEVEMNRHSLTGHVIPQIRTLRDADYTEADADYLATKSTEFDREKLADMIRVAQPDVVVVANKPDARWENEITRLGLRQMIVEIFRSEFNHHIFSVDGEMPPMPADVVSYVQVDPILSNMLIVGSPATLGVQSGADVSLLWRGQLTAWHRADIAHTCYLVAKGRMPLARGKAYALVRTEEEYLTIREETSK